MINKRFKIFALIIIGTLFYFVANFQRIAIPGAVFDILEQDLKAGAPVIATLGATFMYVYAFSQLIVGVLVDRFGGFRVIIVGAVLLALGCLMFPLSSYLPLMYLSRALAGFGSGTLYLSLIKELKNTFEEKDFGLAISVMLFIGYCGGVFANAPFVAMMKYMSWREILVTISVVVILAYFIFIIVLKTIKLPDINKNAKIRTLPFWLVLHKKHNRNLFSFACCNFGICYVLQTVIGKKFLEDFCLMQTSSSSFVLSLMAIIAAVFNIVNALVCKMCRNQRVKFLKTASVITFLSLFFICLMIVFNVKSIFISIIFCIIAANASLSSILVPVLHLTNHKMVSTTAVSIMNFCFFMMVGILGTLTGFLLEIFEPRKVGDLVIYSDKSYLLIFGTFFLLSLFEMYKARKLSNKY